MSSIILEKPADPRTCVHEATEPLGHDEGAVFLRCTTCGSIVIGRGKHRWIIRPTDQQGPLPL